MTTIDLEPFAYVVAQAGYTRDIEINGEKYSVHRQWETTSTPSKTTRQIRILLTASDGKQHTFYFDAEFRNKKKVVFMEPAFDANEHFYGGVNIKFEVEFPPIIPIEQSKERKIEEEDYQMSFNFKMAAPSTSVQTENKRKRRKNNTTVKEEDEVISIPSGESSPIPLSEEEKYFIEDNDDLTKEEIISILQGEECGITNEQMADPVRLQCGHFFEKKAIVEWKQKQGTCPTCIRPIVYMKCYN